MCPLSGVQYFPVFLRGGSSDGTSPSLPLAGEQGNAPLPLSYACCILHRSPKYVLTYTRFLNISHIKQRKIILYPSLRKSYYPSKAVHSICVTSEPPVSSPHLRLLGSFASGAVAKHLSTQSHSATWGASKWPPWNATIFMAQMTFLQILLCH